MINKIEITKSCLGDVVVINNVPFDRREVIEFSVTEFFKQNWLKLDAHKLGEVLSYLAIADNYTEIVSDLGDCETCGDYNTKSTYTNLKII